MIEFTTTPIDEQAVLDSVKTDDCGACVLFVGTTRKFTGQRETQTLVYEAYGEMAIKAMNRLSQQAAHQWPIKKCSIVHRLGHVELGKTSIAVAVSSPHRKDAFEAAEWLMNKLKTDVPIWKQEHWIDGSSEWVHPGWKSTSGGDARSSNESKAR